MIALVLGFIASFSISGFASNVFKSISTTTGALQVQGGAGIQGNLNVGQNITCVGDFTVNGTFTTTGTTLSTFVNDWQKAQIPYTTATITTDGALQLVHTLGGEILLDATLTIGAP